ncbi:MAG: hypothetical protein SFT94_05125 [Pseudanabaenaceae cyanobacterium bins.68]|nr:hypothetical protein [Pseudanabaenaceae cyanobacterium bins.68]
MDRKLQPTLRQGTVKVTAKRYLSLLGMALGATAMVSACTTDGKIVIECTVTDPKTRINQTIPVETTADKQGTACDEARAQAKAGNLPLDPATTPPTPTVTVPDSEPKKELFGSAFVPGQDNAGELIPVVDPQKRKEELNSRLTKSDRDPFSAIPGTVRIPNISEPKPQVLRRAPRRPSAVPAVRVDVPPPPVVEPKTDEANAVTVSGIIEIKGITYAIISAPNEPTTRYVSAGTRISNNQVLVKRIENTGVPTLILEQNGVEVVRQVGKAAVTAGAPATPNPLTPPAPANLSPQPSTSQVAPAPGATPPSPTAASATQPRLVTPGGTFVPGLSIINNTPLQ